MVLLHAIVILALLTVPGFLLTWVIFPSREALSAVERWALGCGLSLLLLLANVLVLIRLAGLTGWALWGLLLAECVVFAWLGLRGRPAERAAPDDEALQSFWSSQLERWEAEHSRTGYGARLHGRLIAGRLAGCGRALEIGFGDGRHLDLLRRMGVQAHGVDIVRQAAVSAHAAGAHALQADCRALPYPDDLFDATFSWGVFEHFDGTQQAIREQCRVTRPGGTMLFTVPNRWTPYTILTALWHMKRGTWSDRPASWGKRYSPGELRRMLRGLPLYDVTVRPFYVGAICEVPALRRFSGLFEAAEDSPLRYLGLMVLVEARKRARDGE